MDGLTKQTVEQSELDALVKHAFGTGVGVRSHSQFSEGWFNTAYAVSLTSGEEVIFKISPPAGLKLLRYETNIMRAEVAMLRLMNDLGHFPVPKVLHYDDSGRLTSGEYFFMTRVNGHPYNHVKDSFSPAQRDAIEAELGRCNRLINNVVGTHFGPFSERAPKYATWSEAFRKMMDDILQDGREYNVALPMAYDELYGLLNRKWHVLDEVIEPRLVHWDLWDANILVDEQGALTGLIDFERALWGDPLIEVYFSHFYDSAGFLRGYGQDLLAAPGARTRRMLYNLYLMLIMVIECEYRQYPEQHKNCCVELLQEGIHALYALS